MGALNQGRIWRFSMRCCQTVSTVFGDFGLAVGILCSGCAKELDKESLPMCQNNKGWSEPGVDVHGDEAAWSSFGSFSTLVVEKAAELEALVESARQQRVGEKLAKVMAARIKGDLMKRHTHDALVRLFTMLPNDIADQIWKRSLRMGLRGAR